MPKRLTAEGRHCRGTCCKRLGLILSLHQTTIGKGDFMSGRIDFTLDFNRLKAGYERSKDSPYRIYVLGNFSGQTGVSWEQRKIVSIDIDSFDQVMSRIQPTLETEAGFRLAFETLDDFHPDVWLQRVPILADLLTLKQQLSNPRTAAQAAAKIKAFLPESTNDNAVQPQAPSETQAEMLERLLGKRPEPTSGESDAVQRLVEQMVSPFVSKAAEPQHQTLIDIIDATVSEYLRMLLHRPDFQALESLWRATAALVSEESADEQLFFLIDIDQSALLTELRSGRQVFEQQLLAHIQSGDDEQDVLLLGAFAFSDSADDSDLLGLCSCLATSCKAYFLGSAGPTLIENVIFAAFDNAQKWNHYLKQVRADSVILAYPRYLSRLPYGNKRDPLETIAFEECSATPESGELLWGNPAFLCVRVLIRNTQEQKMADPFFFRDMPSFTFDKEGAQVLQPGAEFVMTEKQANALLSQGIMPVIAYHQRQGVRLLALSTLSSRSSGRY